MAIPAIPDDEVVLRHIPSGGITPTAAGERINSDNFRLRAAIGETGVSVTRRSMTSPSALVARVGDAAAGSRAAALEVRAIRELGLDVVPVPLADDPGHAEIRSAQADLEDRKTRR